jgi:hypothetical protein
VIRAAFVVAVFAAACGSPQVYPDLPAPISTTLVPLLDHAHIGSNSTLPDFQHAHAPFTLPGGPFSDARLVVDLESPCFPFDKWTADPPPAGQNWPADCDAFDRNFEMSLDGNLELVRAITPFGGPLHIEADVTDVANGLPGDHDFGVLITTYSDAAGQVSGSNGGWTVSASLLLTPGTAPRNVLAVLPVFYGDLTDSSPKMTTVNLISGAASARLEYRATGHGGAARNSIIDCSGPAEEFCQRTQHVQVDGSDVEPPFVLWRDDCDTLCTLMHQGPASGGFDYCQENPCGSVDSVRAARANWCPGSVTPPRSWDPPALHAAGDHTLTFQVDNLAPGGLWRVSSTLFLFSD